MRMRARAALAASPNGDTPRDVERALVLAIIVVRLLCVVEMAAGAPRGLEVTSARSAYLALTIATASFLVTMCLYVWRRGEFPSVWGHFDIVFAALALLVCSLVLPSRLLLGTWAAWGSGYAVGAAATAGVWAPTVRRAGLWAGALGALYLLVTLRAGVSDVGSVLANAASYPMFGLAAAETARFARSMARQAEEANRRAALAAARVELDRYRLTVHDVAGILRLLSDETTPESMLPALRAQARDESRRLRNYLSDSKPRFALGEGQPALLGQTVWAAAQGFGDLPIEMSLDLGQDVRLEGGDAEALVRALMTIFHNVRRHARAEQVVVHADSEHERWELTIADDGVGFDQAATPLGFGLAVQVMAELTTRQMSVDLRSAPGDGTTIRIRGDRR